jgi:hypothetical protein
MENYVFNFCPISNVGYIEQHNFKIKFNKVGNVYVLPIADNKVFTNLDAIKKYFVTLKFKQ